MSCGAKRIVTPGPTVEGPACRQPYPTLLTTFCCWACFCRRLATSRHRASFSLQHRLGQAGPPVARQGHSVASSALGRSKGVWDKGLGYAST